MVDALRISRYGGLSIALHWVTVLLFIAVYATIELRELFPKASPPREALKQLHFMLGLSIFALVWLRLFARLVWSGPAETEGPGWQRVVAGTVHAGLYGLMIAMPLAGWLTLSAAGKPVPFFGFTLPPLVLANEGLSDRIEELHELGGTIGYVLIGLHASAALLHHYVLKDGSLSRMLPARS